LAAGTERATSSVVGSNCRRISNEIGDHLLAERRDDCPADVVSELEISFETKLAAKRCNVSSLKVTAKVDRFRSQRSKDIRGHAETNTPIVVLQIAIGTQQERCRLIENWSISEEIEQHVTTDLKRPDSGSFDVDA